MADNGTIALNIFCFLKLIQPEKGGAGSIGDLQAAKGNPVGDRHPIAGGQIGGHLQHMSRGQPRPDQQWHIADRRYDKHGW